VGASDIVAERNCAGSSLIAAIGKAFLAAAGDVTAAAQTVCTVVADAFGDSATVRLLDDAGMMQVVATWSPDEAVTEELARIARPVPFAGSLAQTLRDRRPVWIEAPATLSFSSLHRRAPFLGTMVAPIVSDGAPLGFLAVVCTSHADGHPDSDLQLLGEIADRCGAEIRQARLLGQLGQDLEPSTEPTGRHNALLAHASDIIALVSPAGTVLEVTPAIETVLGWTPAMLIGGSLLEVVDLADRPRVHDVITAARQRPGRGEPVELRVRHRDGRLRWVEVTANDLLDDPALGAIVLTAREVTERHDAAELLEGENEILQQIATGAPLSQILDAICGLVEARTRAAASAIWLVEGGRAFLASSPALPSAGARRLEDWHRGDEVGSLTADPNVVTVLDARDRPKVPSALDVACSWGRPIVDPFGDVVGRVNVYLAEERQPKEADRQVLALACHLAGMAQSRDEARRELAHAATHDALTGLPNRSLFLDRLARVLARSTDGDEVSVLFVDLDDFKWVNDTSGHGVGDLLLQEAAARLAGVVRPLDLIARLGGDEFAILCGELSSDGASSIAARVLQALEAPFELDGRTFHVSASVGISSAGGGTLPDLVLRDADTAMYQAKREGRGRYAVFTPAVREANVRRVALERDLRQAIDDEQLTVDYQPVVSLETGELVSLEALARWASPTHGVVGPPEFIDVAEQAGMIGALGLSILRQSVARASAWRASGLIGERCTVSVNVSAFQLADASFVAAVMDTLDAANLPASALCLELTESSVMADVEGAQATLGLLRSLGVSLAIDDFGTGHSSLARLRSLEATVLKLDRMFILDLDVDHGSVEMVKSIVQLAHAVGKRLVVEGVERPSQLLLLQHLGADAAQGFYLSRPQPADAIEGFLRTNPTWF
jgi:diguanylate cyclase (GGDEF)-like protein/PAS domain S-box-containing protein